LDDAEPTPAPRGATGADPEAREQATASAAADPRWYVRHRLWFVVGPILALIACTNAGNSLATTWSRDHPLALIALNSGNDKLLLTTNQLDAWSYYTVAMVRLFVSDPLFFLLGRWYGDRAIRWLERKLPSQGELIRTIERWFGKAGVLVVFIAPNNQVCLIAGASTMSFGVFLVADVLGTAGRLWLLRVLGHEFREPIAAVLDFFGRYRWQLLVVSVVLVAFSVLSDLRRGKGDVKAMLDLESDLEGQPEATGTGPGPEAGDSPG
jgi:membrane protein DedA with SNARE-associated domain